jgi:hypothetical protein
MRLQQILVEATDFTSPNGNQIVARSANIDEGITKKMAAWATVRAGLLPRQLTATFFASFSKRYSLLGRSFAGGYDPHGDRALYSQLVLLNAANLRAFENNAVLIARVLNSSGAWMLSSELPDELPEIEMPNGTINSFAYSDCGDNREHILKSMALHDRIGFTDATEPLAFMGAFLNSLDLQERAKIGFSIGRRFFEEAPFNISFYPGGDLRLEQELTQRQVYPIRLRTSGNHRLAEV